MKIRKIKLEPKLMSLNVFDKLEIGGPYRGINSMDESEYPHTLLPKAQHEWWIDSLEWTLTSFLLGWEEMGNELG